MLKEKAREGERRGVTGWKGSKLKEGEVEKSHHCGGTLMRTDFSIRESMLCTVLIYQRMIIHDLFDMKQ
jgi:hypothetical protein